MQFENEVDFKSVAAKRGYGLYYAAVLDDEGQEQPITQQMIDQLYERLCAESTTRCALSR